MGYRRAQQQMRREPQGQGGVRNFRETARYGARRHLRVHFFHNEQQLQILA
jgi:hypothetical protein